jgi:hypothetical protein
LPDHTIMLDKSGPEAMLRSSEVRVLSPTQTSDLRTREVLDGKVPLPNIKYNVVQNHKLDATKIG